MVKAVAVVVNTDRDLADDACELAMVADAGELALDVGIRAVVGHHKWKLATHVLQLLFANGASDDNIVTLSVSSSNNLCVLAILSLALGVTLDQTLEGKV